jgi:hypothetical protein
LSNQFTPTNNYEFNHESPSEGHSNGKLKQHIQDWALLSYKAPESLHAHSFATNNHSDCVREKKVIDDGDSLYMPIVLPQTIIVTVFEKKKTIEVIDDGD